MQQSCRAGRGLLPRGIIWKCTATHDCVAEGNKNLMFMKDDVITVLMQIPNTDGVHFICSISVLPD
ncbi:hypothetical protein K435DRAFT_317053, partial [Dendrothele bispora CBS 962.96]